MQFAWTRGPRQTRNMLFKYNTNIFIGIHCIFGKSVIIESQLCYFAKANDKFIVFEIFLNSLQGPVSCPNLISKLTVQMVGPNTKLMLTSKLKGEICKSPHFVFTF